MNFFRTKRPWKCMRSSKNIFKMFILAFVAKQYAGHLNFTFFLQILAYCDVILWFFKCFLKSPWSYEKKMFEKNINTKCHDPTWPKISAVLFSLNLTIRKIEVSYVLTGTDDMWAPKYSHFFKNNIFFDHC